MASSFKRNFEFFAMVIPLPGKPKKVRFFCLNQVKFVKPFAVAARRVSLHGFNRVLQRSAENLFKKVLGRPLYVQKRRKFYVFPYFFAFFPKFYILHYFEEK